MDKQECKRLLNAHRSSNIKPTEKVKEAISFALIELDKTVIKEVEDSRVKPLQNRCYVLSQGTLCFFCPMECEHRQTPFRESN